MLVLLALSAGFGEFPKVAPELELPGRMTYSGTTSSTCDPFKEDWRYAYVSGAEMNLAGVDYGQKVTRVQCFDACGSDPACAQAVCYSAGVTLGALGRWFPVTRSAFITREARGRQWLGTARNR